MFFHAYFLRNFRFFFVAVVILALQVCTISAASAASYSIGGRVYSAARLLPLQPPPPNPLSAFSSSQILKDKDLADINLYAVTTKSLVRVSVENQLGVPYAKPFLVRYSGGYNFSFINPAATLGVKLVVRDPLTNEKLMESALTTLSPNANNRYLLVEGEHDDVGKPHPGTNLFTMVGRIPNDGTSITRTDDPVAGLVAGLANVSPTTSANYEIPQYRNAPFGSTLNITGAFSSQYYPTGSGTDQYCYKVYASNVPIKTQLSKTKYTVTDVNGSLLVKAEQVLVGPQKIGTVNECYAITPITATLPNQDIFWNLPDLLVRWNTAPIANGLFHMTAKLFNTGTGAEVPITPNSYSTLTLQINNEPVVVEFSSIFSGPKNILTAANACDIVPLDPGLKITYKAYHPNSAGYLGSYSFAAVPNCCSTIQIASGSSSGNPYSGTPSAGNVANLNSTGAPNSTMITQSCAYILGLSAVARTTDGYWYFNGKYIQKAYYLQ